MHIHFMKMDIREYFQRKRGSGGPQEGGHFLLKIIYILKENAISLVHCALFVILIHMMCIQFMKVDIWDWEYFLGGGVRGSLAPMGTLFAKMQHFEESYHFFSIMHLPSLMHIQITQGYSTQICCIGCSINSTTFLVEQSIRNLVWTSKRGTFWVFKFNYELGNPKGHPLSCPKLVVQNVVEILLHFW